MAFLGIDIDGARALTDQLRTGAAMADHAVYELAQAEALADLPIGCSAILDEIASEFMLLAGRVDWAVEHVLSLRLKISDMVSWEAMPPPVRTPEPVLMPLAQGMPESVPVHPAQWDAAQSSQWQHVHQVSSHNSYETPGGVQVLFDAGVRSFELDVHHRAAVDWFGPVIPGIPGSWLLQSGLLSDDDVPRWHVYHVTGASFREYDNMRQGLDAIASLETTDPITVFIDNKDGFDGQHTIAAFDQVLGDALGSRLYTPAMFRAQAPDLPTLVDVAHAVGWPQVDELQGRVMVVLTDDIDGYARPEALAFIAPPPEFEPTEHGVPAHVPLPGAVFYNAHARRITSQEIAAVHATGTILRTYFNPHCSSDVFGEVSARPQYRAVDVVVDDPECPERTLVPPVDLPVPVLPASEG